MFKPMFALHKDEAGNVIAASSFVHEYQLTNWLRDQKFRAGDNLEFREAVVRSESDEIAPNRPVFLDSEPSDPVPVPQPALAGEDQPF